MEWPSCFGENEERQAFFIYFWLGVKIGATFLEGNMARFIRRCKSVHTYFQQIYPKKITEYECKDSALSAYTFRIVMSFC